MEYTKGSWKAIAVIGTLWEIQCREDDAVAEVYGHNDKEAEVNAHLISASPDLYEALKIASEVTQEYIKEADMFCDHQVGICCCAFFSRIDCIQEAIAKAEGKS